MISDAVKNLFKLVRDEMSARHSAALKAALEVERPKTVERVQPSSDFLARFAIHNRQGRRPSKPGACVAHRKNYEVESELPRRSARLANASVRKQSKPRRGN